MRPTFLTTTFLALVLAGPAMAQRSLFDQPVQGQPAPAPAPAPAPTPVPAPPPVTPAPSAAPAQAEEPVAQPRKAARRKPTGPVPARSLAVFNGSPQALVGLEVSQGGRSAKLKKPLAAGKRTRLALPAFKACEVGVSATFEGAAPGEAMPVDICKEKSLNFRD